VALVDNEEVVNEELVGKVKLKLTEGPDGTMKKL